MSEEPLQTFTYRILRYTPNLIRDEWINIGVLLHDPARNILRARMIEEGEAFARLRKLRFDAEESLLRALQSDLEAQAAAHRDGAGGYLNQLDDTLSNLLQLSPQKAVLSADLDAELERLYADHVAPPIARPRGAAEATDTRASIRARAREIFRRLGISKRLAAVRAAEYTFPGDPLRIDFGWRSNGTRGFFQPISLTREPAPAKEYAFTAERIRQRVDDCQFAAITMTALQSGNDRHQFVQHIFAEQKIEIVPVTQLDEYASGLRPLWQ
ncbi:MAG TPA: DUF3037 domain-containing protein [Candidatus Acidoferrales bacterium]|nr:DUF3037 domain-containing protein [Candidatus Acidoferrales bacterium]